MPPARVAIVGGGIAGLASALALRQHGIASTIYERVDALREVGAGIALWPNGTRVLDTLGILDAVAARAGQATTVEVLSASGARLARMHTARDDAPSLCVRRPDLLAVLADAVGGECLRLGAEVERVEARGDSAVLRCADGSRVEADVVVAADGLRSRIRGAVFPPVAVRYRGYTVWRGVGPATAGWPRADACEVWGRGQRFGLFRLPDGQAYWYVCASRPAGQRAADERAEAARVAAGWHPAIRATIDGTADVHRHDVWDRSARGRTVAGRVVLVGDAAHGMTPDLGQGGAQALVDAHDLAHALANAGSVPSALAGFERRQRRRTVPLALQSRLAGRIGQLSGPAARVRDLATRATPSRAFAAAFTAAY